MTLSDLLDTTARNASRSVSWDASAVHLLEYISTQGEQDPVEYTDLGSVDLTRQSVQHVR